MYIENIYLEGKLRCLRFSIHSLSLYHMTKKLSVVLLQPVFRRFYKIETGT